MFRLEAFTVQTWRLPVEWASKPSQTLAAQVSRREENKAGSRMQVFPQKILVGAVRKMNPQINKVPRSGCPIT